MARPPIELREQHASSVAAKHIAWVLYSYVRSDDEGEWLVWHPMAVIAAEACCSERSVRDGIAELRKHGGWARRVNRLDYRKHERSVLLLRRGSMALNVDPIGEDLPPDRQDSAAPPAEVRRTAGESSPHDAGESSPHGRRKSAPRPAKVRRRTGGSSSIDRRTSATAGEKGSRDEGEEGKNASSTPSTPTTLVASTVDQLGSSGDLYIEEISVEQYLDELERERARILGMTDENNRWLVEAAALNVEGQRGAAAEAVLVRGIRTHTWPRVREVIVWGWEQVADGKREPSLQACTLTGGGLNALVEQHGRAQAVARRKATEKAAKTVAAAEGPSMPSPERLAAIRRDLAAQGSETAQELLEAEEQKRE